MEKLIITIEDGFITLNGERYVKKRRERPLPSSKDELKDLFNKYTEDFSTDSIEDLLNKEGY